MDSLLSLGRVHTMEEDLAAARNNKRQLPGNSVAPENRENMAAEKIRIPVAPMTPIQKSVPTLNLSLPPKPATGTLPPRSLSEASKQFPSPVPKREISTPATAPTQAQTRPAPPSIPRLPTKPLLSGKEEKPQEPLGRFPAPAPTPRTPAPLNPQVAPRQNPDLARLLPVEEDSKSMPPLESKNPPLATPTVPLPGKIIIPIRPQGTQVPIGPGAYAAPETLPKPVPQPSAPAVYPVPQKKTMTPEEILGITPSVSPLDMETPLSPITERLVPAGKPLGIIPIQTPQPERPASPAPLPIYQSPYREKRGAPFALMAGFAVLVLAIGGFLVWQITHKNSPQPSKTPPAAAVTPPSPFFKPESTSILTLQQGRESFLVEQIRALENSPGSPLSITYIPIKKSPDGSFLQTKEFFSTIGVSIPQELLDNVDSQFMLYLYTPGPEEKTRCAAGSIFDASCYSPRLGIVLKINTDKQIAVQNIMSGLEPTLVQIFKPIILDSPAFDQATPWDTATYRGISVRYTNLPISTTSLNWTEVGNYLVIATSKNSSYSALDKLTSSASSAGQ